MEIPSCEVQTTTPQLTINDVSANEGLSLTFTVTLDHEVAGGFAVTPNFTDGTATKGTDYTENIQAISFTGTAHETQTLTVSTMEDDLVESDETFTVGLTVSETNETITTTDTGVGTINNDDVVTVSISVTPNPVKEGNSVTVQARLSNVVFSDVTLPLLFTEKTAENTDYKPLSSISILQNEITVSGSVATIVDKDSDDEIFTIELGKLPPNVLLGETGSIDVTILDHGILTSIESSMDDDMNTIFSLEQNYPNPFNPSTSIEFSLKKTQHVTLSVYDILGQKVQTLVDEIQSQGHHHVVFSANGLSSSKYFYVLKTDHHFAVKVMTLLK